MCIVSDCDRATAWAPLDASLGDYCQPHIDGWLMAEDRADFADEYHRDARSEVA
jgi:hypothetical protein